jgi:hypothetical protein
MLNLYLIWLRVGIRMGWVSLPYCATHDGGMEYWSEEEAEEWEGGGDPCQVVLRILD